jgi:hypothetical protein
VILQVRAPAIEHGHAADFGPEVLRFSGALPQGLGGGFQREAVDHLRTVRSNRAECRRRRTHVVTVFKQQQFRLSGVHTLHGRCDFALRAVTVTAQVVGDPLVAAVIATLDASALGQSGKRRCRSGVSVPPSQSRKATRGAIRARELRPFRAGRA